jgi:hypothetical protein
MELLDRYLQAVRFWLPKGQQDDIIAELGDDLRSQIEDRESALGRPLNENEIAAFLQQTGRPLWVAGRYQKQQSLIGPVLFPLYRFVLKIAVLGYLAPWLLVWIVLAVFMPSHRAGNPTLTVVGGWASLWINALVIFGTVTLVFAVLERFQSNIKILQRWDPRKLPRLAKPKDRVSRVESVFGLAFGVLYVVWWLSLPRYAHVLFASGAAEITLNSALRAWYLPALVPTMVVIVQQCINLLRPQWTWLRAVTLLLADSIALVIFVSVAGISPYVIASGRLADPQYTQAFVKLNQVIHWNIVAVIVGICIALLAHAWQTVRELRRFANGRRNGAALQASQTL